MHTFYFKKEDWLNINPHTVKKNNCEPSTTEFGGKITGKIPNVQNVFRNLRRKTSKQNKALPSFYCLFELEKNMNADVELIRYMEKNTSIKCSKILPNYYFQVGSEQEPIKYMDFLELCK